MYFSADIICSEKPTVFVENCEFRRTDNVQGHISQHIFAPNGGHRVYFPSYGFTTRAVLRIRKYSRARAKIFDGLYFQLGKCRIKLLVKQAKNTAK